MRDELLLRFFFADLLDEKDALAVVRRMRERSEWIVARFREIEPDAKDGFTEGRGELYPYLALRYGIGLMEWMAGWAAETERAFAEGRAPLESPRAPLLGSRVSCSPSTSSPSRSTTRSPDGETITVFAREARAAGKEDADLPWLVFLQGGPGSAATRPTGLEPWILRRDARLPPAAARPARHRPQHTRARRRRWRASAPRRRRPTT